MVFCFLDFLPPEIHSFKIPSGFNKYEATFEFVRRNFVVLSAVTLFAVCLGNPEVEGWYAGARNLFWAASNAALAVFHTLVGLQCFF